MCIGARSLFLIIFGILPPPISGVCAVVKSGVLWYVMVCSGSSISGVFSVLSNG